jgi:hypothetical protein
MSKSIHFFSQTVFGQLISLIDRKLIESCVSQTQSDRYCKGFTTKDHLISMLFSSLSQCSSLREVVAGCLGLLGKKEQIGLKHLPRKSTLSDANALRTPKVFEKIYLGLLSQYRHFISDSRLKIQLHNELFIIDSTSISLFKNILKSVGKQPVSGKSKGGIKAHMMINASEMLPELVWFTSAAASDVPVLDKVPYKKDAVYVFDKGYIDYLRWEKITQAGSYFVTRLKDNAIYESLQELELTDDVHSAILKDELIGLPVRKNGIVIRRIKFRRVAFWDEKECRLLVFVTNMLEVKPDQIADIYKQRWQIETLFRNLKQNFPLKYFLGDNENAIVIQIWSALIANLLLRIINKKITRTWAYSNLVSFTRIHLFNFINLINFLNDPEKDWEIQYQNQLSLFPT